MVQNRLRILVISNYYPPDIKGGLEISASIICNSLAKRGHQVTVLTRKNPSIQGGSIENLTVHRIFEHRHRFVDIPKSHPRLAGWYSVAAAFLNGKVNRPILKAFLKGRSFDVAICFSLEDLGQSLAGVIDEAGIPILWSVGDYWKLDQREFGTKGVLAKLRRNIVAQREVNLELDIPFENVVFISENFRSEFSLRGCSPSNTRVIYRSYPVPDSVPEFDHSIRKPRFVIASQMVRHKGIHVAVEAAKILHESNSGLFWDLDIFGDGDAGYRNELSDYVISNSIKHRVHFHGKISPSEVSSQFQSSLSVIHPVIWQEPFGRVVIEAMANGAAVIASDTGPIREILSDDYPLLFLPNDSAALAKHMENLLIDADLWCRVVKQNLARHHEFFTPEIELEKYEEILHSLARSN